MFYALPVADNHGKFNVAEIKCPFFLHMHRWAQKLVNGPVLTGILQEEVHRACYNKLRGGTLIMIFGKWTKTIKVSKYEILSSIYSCSEDLNPLNDFPFGLIFITQQKLSSKTIQ